MTDTKKRICYAHSLGNCKGKLSREHYFSNVLLQRMRQEGPIEVQGFATGVANQVRQASPESLVANILCGRHNSDLSPVDTEGSRWITEIFDAANAIHKKSLHADEVVEIDGSSVERWILKIVCGMVSSGNASMDGIKIPKTPPPPSLVKVLFGLRSLGGTLGLYVRPVGHIKDSARINFSVMNTFERVEGTRHHLTGVELHHSGLSTFLKLVDDFASTGDVDLSKAVFRPPFLEFHAGSLSKRVRINVKWPHGAGSHGIGIRILEKDEMPPASQASGA